MDASAAAIASRRIVFPPVGLFWRLSYQRTDLTEATILLRHYGKAVARIADRLDMRRIQAASCGRPFVRSLGPLLRAMSRATATVRCAIPGCASISGSETRAAKRSAMRWLRATSLRGTGCEAAR